MGNPIASCPIWPFKCTCCYICKPSLTYLYSLPYSVDNSILSDPKITQFYEETLVTFGELSEDVIKGYIETGEPM